jgi:hypothetical protein
MQKSLTGFVALAGVLIAAPALVAADWQSGSSRNRENPQPRTILLTSGTALMSEADPFPAPPPAPAIEGTVPPGPTPLSMSPVPSAGPAAAGGPPIAMAPGLALYPRVKYHDRRHIAPCAVPMVVAVRDPCAKRDPCCACGPPSCVLVEICVPPCGCPKVCTKHDGAKVRYDYGRYAVNITSRHGVIVVDYDG